jgi:hypothetical protein
VNDSFGSISHHLSLTLSVVAVLVVCCGCKNITIDSKPRGATVQFDGRYVGTTPTTLHVKITPDTLGSHLLMVTKDGYNPWKTTFQDRGPRGTTYADVLAQLEPEQGANGAASATAPQLSVGTTPRLSHDKLNLGTHWAVIIGVAQYQDTRIPALRYGTADAQAFHDWLVSSQGGRYSPAQVKLLLDASATAANMKDALFNWLKQALEEDMVTIYFAGHGSPELPDSLNNLFFLPYDTKYDNIATTGFPMWDIETALKRFIKARKVLVIADACHSGGVGQPFDVARRDGRGMAVAPVAPELQKLASVSDGVCVICAADEKQLSQEGQNWGGGHGVFTWCLLRGLQGEADFNKDGAVTLGELIQFTSEQVRRETRNAQSPTVAGRYDPALTIGK